MRRMNFLVIFLTTLSLNAAAFFNTGSFSPFGSGTGFNNSNPWSSNSNWNPFSENGQFSPENDAKNLARYGAHPRTLKNYRQDPRFKPENVMTQTINQVQPSNWLTETDFSKTLETIKNTGSKTFFVGESPINFDQGYQRIRTEAQEIDRSVRDYIQQHSKQLGSTDNIYGKQGYALSPAASSVSRVELNN